MQCKCMCILFFYLQKNTRRILRFIGRVLFEVNSLSDAGTKFSRALEIDQRVRFFLSS